jgi:hypothetical protein
MTEPASAWVVISRPDRLPNAIAAAQALRALFPGGVHLLREHSKWWERAQWQPSAAQFTTVHAFPRVETCRGLRDLPRLYRESAGRVRALSALPIDAARDVLFCLGGILTICNAAASAHPSVRKVLCVPANVFSELHQQADRARYRFTTSGWMQNRIVEPLAGLHRTLRFKPRFNPGGDGVRVERLEASVERIYDRVVVMSNHGAEVAGEGAVLGCRFPSIADLRDLPAYHGANDERRVLFFGTPFLLVHNIAPRDYITQLNACLDYLRANYPEHQLVYRPHPNETTEATQLDLRDFAIEDDREVAELYFLRNFSRIGAVFSVSSTVSRTALNNGLNAYALYPLFPFTGQQRDFFRTIMGEVPPQFNIRDLTRPPVPYQPLPPSSGRSFAEAVRVAASVSAAAEFSPAAAP